MELWLALLLICAGVLLLLSLVVCCTVKCFRPENTKGPKWVRGEDGKERVVKGFFKIEGNDSLQSIKPALATPAAPGAQQ